MSQHLCWCREDTTQPAHETWAAAKIHGFTTMIALWSRRSKMLQPVRLPTCCSTGCEAAKPCYRGIYASGCFRGHCQGVYAMYR